jgi:hypothetical protein
MTAQPDALLRLVREASHCLVFHRDPSKHNGMNGAPDEPAAQAPADEAAGGRRYGAALGATVALVIAALMACYLLASRRAVGEFGFPLDDSWIHVRFAQNLARGYGFSFNPGQPASTTTGPLWTLVLALGYRLTGEYLFTSAALNWLFCLLAALTAGALARTLIPNRSFGAAAALLVAVTIPLPWLALSGMEPALSVWLALLAILLHVRWRHTGGVKSLAPTLVFGLAVYSRPELVLLFPLAMLDRLLMAAREQPGGRYAVGWLKDIGLHTPLFAAIVAPLVIYNERVIGRPLPSSYYVKAWNFGITWALAMRDNRLLMQSLFIAPLKEIGALLLMWAGNNVVLIAPFVYAFVRMIRAPLSSPQRSLLIPLLLFVQPVAWAVSTNFHRAPWFQSQRYVANLGPLYLIVGLAGAWWLWNQRFGERRRPLLFAGLALVLAASLARHPDQARMYALNVKNITQMQVTTARWLKRHVPKDSLLGANDVGAIAAITDMRVLDMIGLVSPEIIRHLTFENARTGAWQRLVWQEAAQRRVDYLVVVMRPERYQGFIRAGDKPIFRTEITDNITCGGPLIVVFEPRWKVSKKAPQTASTSGTP